jgi:small subunit ribosomal protein S7
MKLFDKWDVSGIEVKDPGIKPYINIKAVLVPKQSRGRHAKHQFYKANVNIVERLMNHLFVPGHKGKRHKTTSSRCAGSSLEAYKILQETFELIERKKKENPILVLVRAIENAALREEISSYQIGSIVVRRAVITSPLRRVDLALRHLVQGAYQKKIKSNMNMAAALCEEIILAYENKKTSYAIAEKERLEKEAEGSR